jgi:DNA-binding NarL/FixJ family response regulator
VARESGKRPHITLKQKTRTSLVLFESHSGPKKRRTAKDGNEAIKLAKQHDGEIPLMLTDVVMPQMSGRELAEQLATFRKDMRVLFTSGYTDDAIVLHGFCLF